MATEPAHEDPFSGPQTLPAGINVCCRGYAREEDATAVGQQLGAAAGMISRIIDLTTLDGFTVAYDYQEALRELDRGRDDLAPLTPSQGEIIGVGMSPLVVRGEQIKTHIVISAPHAEGFLETNANDAFRHSLGLLAHECAHVEVHQWFNRAFPGMMLRHQLPDYTTAVAHQISEVCWEEYAACRLSALFNGGEGDMFAETVTTVTPPVRETVRKAIVEYRLHGDVRRLVQEVGESLHLPFKCVSYLLGHMDGIGESWETHAAAQDALEDAGLFELVGELHEAQRELWSTRRDWASFAVFDRMHEIVLDAFAEAGLFMNANYVDVPFTPDTIS